MFFYKCQFQHERLRIQLEEGGFVDNPGELNVDILFLITAGTASNDKMSVFK